MPNLIIKQGNQQNQVVLKDDITSIGRSDDNILSLKDIKISRKHCQIIKLEEGYKIIDLVSGNGTSVNKEKVKERLLQNNDLIKIGDIEIVFNAIEVSSDIPKFISSSDESQEEVKNTTVIVAPNVQSDSSSKTSSTSRLPGIAAIKTAIEPKGTEVKENNLTRKPSAVISSPYSKLSKASGGIKRSSTTMSNKKTNGHKFSKLQRFGKQTSENNGSPSHPAQSEKRPKSKMFIIGTVGVLVLGGIIGLIFLLGSSGGNANSTGAKTGASGLYEKIKEVKQKGDHQKAVELCDEFANKYKKSKHLSEVKEIRKESESFINKGLEAFQKWQSLKAKADEAKPDEAAEVVNEIKSFIGKYSGTSAATEAQNEMEKLERLAAQADPSIMEFNELRSRVDNTLVSKKKYNEAIKEYEAFLKKYPNNTIITEKIKTEINRIKEKMQ